MTIEKPDMTRVWAANASSGDVVDPDTNQPGKVAAGWVAEVPPYEYFNFIHRWFSQGLAYLNQEGIGSWDPETTYRLGSIAKGSDGKLYVSKSEQSGNDPVSEDESNWELLVNEITIPENSIPFRSLPSAGIPNTHMMVSSELSNDTVVSRTNSGAIRGGTASMENDLVPLSQVLSLINPNRINQERNVISYNNNGGNYDNNTITSNDGFSGVASNGDGLIVYARRNASSASDALYWSEDFGETLIPCTVNGWSSNGSNGKHFYVPGINGVVGMVGTGDEGHACIYRSEDGGKSWNLLLNTNQIHSICNNTGDVSQIRSVFRVLHVSDNRWIAIIRNDNPAIGTTGGTGSQSSLLITIDNGNSWSPGGSGLYGSARSVEKLKNGTLLASVPDFTGNDIQGVYASFSGTDGWTRLTNLFRAFGNPAELGKGVWLVGDLAVAPDETSSKLWITRDYGISWEDVIEHAMVSNIGYFRYVHVVMPGVAYAFLSCNETQRNTRQCTRYFTKDYGHSWEDQGVVEGEVGNANAVYFGATCGDHHFLAVQPDKLAIRTTQNNNSHTAIGKLNRQ